MHEGTLEDGLRGSIWLPEIDDEVLVVFAFGDFREGIILAQLSNGKDLAFWQNFEEQGVQLEKGNCLRGMRSRSGHMFAFVDKGVKDTDRIVLQNNVSDDSVYKQPARDATRMVEKALGGVAGPLMVPDGTTGGHFINLDMTPGEEHIMICDRDGSVLMKFDSVNQCLIVHAQKDIILHAVENLHIKAKSIKMESSQDTEHKAGTTWKQSSGSTMDLEAGGTMTLKGGPDIQLNP